MIALCKLIWYGLIGLFRSRASLEIEILVLRHQLNILRRSSPKRPILRRIDRLVFVGLYGLAPDVLSALAIVRPETVIRWHRAGFRLYWRWKSRPCGGRPKVPLDVRRLIRDISIANPLWGRQGSTASSSSLASRSGRRRLPSTWFGGDDLRARDGRRFFATMLTALRRWICLWCRRSHSDCSTDFWFCTMVAVKSYGLGRPHSRMPNGSLVSSLKHSAGRTRRDLSFVTEIALMAILSSDHFERWAFGIVQPRRDRHGRTDIVKG
jgi:hypothetical protein